MWGPDQLALAGIIVAERHHAGRGGVDAQLVLDGDAADIVERAVAAHFGDQEQRDAARARRRVGQAGEHQVDDVVGKVVLAERDVDFLPLDQESAVTGRIGPRLERAHVGSGLRLGEVHRPGPLAGDELGQPLLLLLRAAVMLQRLDRAGAQHRAEREGHVGGAEILQHHRCEGLGQALAAVAGGS
jgi:hypothetical protein